MKLLVSERDKTFYRCFLVQIKKKKNGLKTIAVTYKIKDLFNQEY